MPRAPGRGGPADNKGSLTIAGRSGGGGVEGPSCATECAGGARRRAEEQRDPMACSPWRRPPSPLAWAAGVASPRRRDNAKDSQDHQTKPKAHKSTAPSDEDT